VLCDGITGKDINPFRINSAALRVDFGTVSADHTKVPFFSFVSSLSGILKRFTSRFVQESPSAGESKISLIGSVEVYPIT
jgi:hypothetical protein